MSQRERDTGIGKAAVKPFGIVVTVLLMVLTTAFAIYSAIVFWPPAVAAGTTAPAATEVHWFGGDFSVTQDERLFIIVAFFGFLGALVHALRSTYWYIGNRNFRRSWLAFYFIVPFVGAAFGVLVYVVLRAGLISTQAQSSDVSPFGFAAVAGLVGLFTQQTAKKLLKVFEVVLTAAETGKDHTAPQDEPEVLELAPATGKAGDTVVIKGRGLDKATEVRFGEIVVAAEMVDDGLSVTVPQDLQPGPVIVTVLIDENTVHEPKTFEVTT
jgi:hypothetical protein